MPYLYVSSLPANITCALDNGACVLTICLSPLVASCAGRGGQWARGFRARSRLAPVSMMAGPSASAAVVVLFHYLDVEIAVQQKGCLWRRTSD